VSSVRIGLVAALVSHRSAASCAWARRPRAPNSRPLPRWPPRRGRQPRRVRAAPRCERQPEETTAGDLGNPIDDASYVLCIYDGSGSPQPARPWSRRAERSAASSPAGSTSPAPGWCTSTTPRGPWL